MQFETTLTDIRGNQYPKTVHCCDLIYTYLNARMQCILNRHGCLAIEATITNREVTHLRSVDDLDTVTTKHSKIIDGVFTVTKTHNDRVYLIEQGLPPEEALLSYLKNDEWRYGPEGDTYSFTITQGTKVIARMVCVRTNTDNNVREKHLEDGKLIEFSHTLQVYFC